ncbi:Myb transcription protein [Lasiodiplodia theobromae]|uniref:Myb transcription protein n=1 Tax=Lasiodiplodia theobromae TaxID=45133 RepID=UPI0015C31C3F|nr:Myb transcription protein [Lasiodiplodia theobromae]KAF4537799.1 Myb transcription protein [Lasiodiplodia theobromae]
MSRGHIKDSAMHPNPAVLASTGPVVRRRWTPAEDDILRTEAELQSKDGRPSDWKRIALRIPGRSNKDCRKRWNKIFTRINKGTWNPEEDEALREAVMQYGCRWAQVAQQVGSRNAEQCAKRWNHSLDPEVDRSVWTKEEDACLLDAITKYGKSWKTIAEQVFPRRSTTDIKNRYSIIIRRQSPNRESNATLKMSESPTPQGISSPEDLGSLSEPLGSSISSNGSPSHFDVLSFSSSSPEMTEVLPSVDNTSIVGLGVGLDKSMFYGLSHVDPNLHIHPTMDAFNALPWKLEDTFSGQVEQNFNSSGPMHWEGGYEDLSAGGVMTVHHEDDAHCASTPNPVNTPNSSSKVTLQMEGVSSHLLHRMLGMLLESQTQFKIESR